MRMVLSSGQKPMVDQEPKKVIQLRRPRMADISSPDIPAHLVPAVMMSISSKSIPVVIPSGQGAMGGQKVMMVVQFNRPLMMVTSSQAERLHSAKVLKMFT